MFVPSGVRPHVRGLLLVQLPCTVHVYDEIPIDPAGTGQRHLALQSSCSDGDIRLLLDKYTGAQSLTLPRRTILTEETISTLQGLPRIRFLDVMRDHTALSINALVQLEGVTTMLSWFRYSEEQHGKWRLSTICENLTTLKHICIVEHSHVHAVPADWQEKLNCLTQLKLLESLASRRVPSPACLAALTKLTRLELSCIDDRHKDYLNSAMDVVPSLPCLKALWLGPCPSEAHLRSLSRMPHLTSLNVGYILPFYDSTTSEASGVCSLRDVHELCCMACVKNLDCKLDVGDNIRVHVWSHGHVEDKVHFCIPGTEYKLTVM